MCKSHNAINCKLIVVYRKSCTVHIDGGSSSGTSLYQHHHHPEDQPGKQAIFWEFTSREMRGVHDDIPFIIDFILRETNRQQLHYIISNILNALLCFGDLNDGLNDWLATLQDVEELHQCLT
uniref:Uncharacterized protein n=1 Tax=Glossina brevipalpis TaxID=37001 RepID=A0A1A9WEU0_9MUSC